MAIKINLEKVLKENNMTSKELQPSIKYVTTCTVM